MSAAAKKSNLRPLTGCLLGNIADRCSRQRRPSGGAAFSWLLSTPARKTHRALQAPAMESKSRTIQGIRLSREPRTTRPRCGVSQNTTQGRDAASNGGEQRQQRASRRLGGRRKSALFPRWAAVWRSGATIHKQRSAMGRRV